MHRSQAKKAGTPSAAAARPAALTNLNMPADAQKNQGYYESLMEAINTILKCPKFSDIQVAEPRAIADGDGVSSGVQATPCFKVLYYDHFHCYRFKDGLDNNDG